MRPGRLADACAPRVRPQRLERVAFATRPPSSWTSFGPPARLSLGCLRLRALACLHCYFSRLAALLTWALAMSGEGASGGPDPGSGSSQPRELIPAGERALMAAQRTAVRKEVARLEKARAALVADPSGSVNAATRLAELDSQLAQQREAHQRLTDRLGSQRAFAASGAAAEADAAQRLVDLESRRLARELAAPSAERRRVALRRSSRARLRARFHRLASAASRPRQEGRDPEAFWETPLAKREAEDAAAYRYRGPPQPSRGPRGRRSKASRGVAKRPAAATAAAAPADSPPLASPATTNEGDFVPDYSTDSFGEAGCSELVGGQLSQQRHRGSGGTTRPRPRMRPRAPTARPSCARARPPAVPVRPAAASKPSAARRRPADGPPAPESAKRRRLVSAKPSAAGAAARAASQGPLPSPTSLPVPDEVPASSASASPASGPRASPTSLPVPEDPADLELAAPPPAAPRPSRAPRLRDTAPGGAAPSRSASRRRGPSSVPEAALGVHGDTAASLAADLLGAPSERRRLPAPPTLGGYRLPPPPGPRSPGPRPRPRPRGSVAEALPAARPAKPGAYLTGAAAGPRPSSRVLAPAPPPGPPPPQLRGREDEGPKRGNPLRVNFEHHLFAAACADVAAATAPFKCFRPAAPPAGPRAARPAPRPTSEPCVRGPESVYRSPHGLLTTRAPAALALAALACALCSGPAFSSDPAGDGPRQRLPRETVAALRDPSRLERTSALAPGTLRARSAALDSLDAFLRDFTGVPLATLASSGILSGHALAAYGRHLFSSGAPWYLFVNAINAFADKWEHWKPFLSPAWGLLRRWQDEEPSERRLVMPVAVLRAGVAVALLWSWLRFAALLLACFTMFLHPVEFLVATRQELILPCDHLNFVSAAYLRISDPKTRRYMRRQHAKSSDNACVQFLAALYAAAPAAAPLYGLSYSAFRRRWDAVFAAVGVPTSEATQGLTPGCLRGSGATWFYMATEDLPRTAWRGRWRNQRTLEAYVQETAGQAFLANLSAPQRDRVTLLAAAAGPLLAAATRRLSG